MGLSGPQDDFHEKLPTVQALSYYLTYKHDSFFSLLSCNCNTFLGLLCSHSHALFSLRQTLHKHIHLGRAARKRKTQSITVNLQQNIMGM